MTIDSDHENSHSDEDEDRAVCPICGLIYPDDGRFELGMMVVMTGLTSNVQLLRVKSMFQMCITVKNVECERLYRHLSCVS